MGIRPVAAVALAVLTVAAAPGTAGAAAGPRWQLVDAPLPSGVVLTAQAAPSVACGSATLCTLVAATGHGAGVADLLTPDGFTTQLLPTVPETSVSSLGNVSCAGPADCVAVGASRTTQDTTGLLESYDGTGWTAAPAPDNRPQLGFSDVACSTATCVAVGEWLDAASLVPYLAERGTDGTWVQRSIAPAQSPNTAAPATNRYRPVRSLYSPACAPDGPCYVLGYQGAAASSSLSAVFLYPSGDAAGSWTSRRLPVPDDVNQDDLRMGGMACAAALNCAAIGTYVNPSADRQYLLGEVFRNGRLVAQRIPIPAAWHTLHDPLNPRAISCPTVNRCVGVVGFRYSTARHGALIVSYDGTRWTSRIAPAPQGATSAAATDLTGVACVSSASCTAVGAVRVLQQGESVLRPLIETLVADTWRPSRPALPEDVPSAADAALADVACAGTTCLADGQWSASGGFGLLAGVAR